ncbi:appetite-regulating hormone isoform X2 [Nelusetta ayraudi]|uniref:appetite-regulating hormone isoform X2 n=1 Tax=Nelusetta ayraudi TaxID=303726 RepID=UPI003F72542F
MFLKRNTCLLAILLFSLTVWFKSTSAGSSFLSPSQKPQSRTKPSRVGRQAMREPSQPSENNQFTITAPFEIGITMREEDFEEYGVSLQDVVEHLLGYKWTAETPPQK